MNALQDVMATLTLWSPALIAAIGWVAKLAGWPKGDPDALTSKLLTGCRRISGADRPRSTRPLAERVHQAVAVLRAVTVAALIAVAWAVFHNGLIAVAAGVVAFLILMALREAATLVVVGVLAVVVGSAAWSALVGVFWWLVLPAVVVVVAVVGDRAPGKAQADPDPMLDPDRWARALRAVNPGKLAAKDKEGRWLNPFTVTVKRTVNAHGDRAYRVRLPQGITAGECESKADVLIHGFNVTGVPRARWRVEMAGEVALLKVSILAPLPDLSPRAPEPLTGRWRDPWRVGRDMRGRDVHVPIFDTGGILFGGIPGYGKTVALRSLVMHYAADPDAVLWGVDGKNSAEDWGPIRPRFERWVDHDEDDERVTVARFLAMLTDALTECRRRQRQPRSGLPGMLVMVEEASFLRDDMTKTELAESDRLQRQIAKQGRAVNVLLAVSAQRPSAGQIDTNLRALFGVRLAFRAASADDARMTLGTHPADDEVTRFGKGEALLAMGEGEGYAKVLADYLTPEAWRAFCRSLPAVGGAVQAGGQASPQGAPVAPSAGPQDAPTTPRPADDGHLPPVLLPAGLADAASAVAQAEAGRLTPNALWLALPEDTRPADKGTMGRQLAEYGWKSRAVRVTAPTGKTTPVRFYVLADFHAMLAADQASDSPRYPAARTPV